MLLDEQYRSRFYNYQLMKQYLDGEISPDDFRIKYFEQRRDDLNFWKKAGRTFEKYEEELKNLSENEKKFREEYSDLLRNENIETEDLKKYEAGLEKYNIVGGQIWEDIHEFIFYHIELYYPSNTPEFDPMKDISEEQLYYRIKSAYNLLKRHKKRWELEYESFYTKNPDENGKNNHEEKPSSK